MLSKLLINIFFHFGSLDAPSRFVLFIILYAFKAFNKHLHFWDSPLGQAGCHGSRNTIYLWNIYGKSMGIIYGKAWVGQKVATYSIILQFNEGLRKNLNI